MMNENDILGFDPTQLSIFNETEQATTSNGPSNIYRPRPKDSKSEDGVYRSTIKIIYNPFDFAHSVLELQSYALQDENGFFVVDSSLSVNDKNCPVFKAWKSLRYSDDPNKQKMAAPKEKGGLGLFDKRQARYCTIQVINDPNNPDLNGKYLFWKLPKFILDAINAKMNPAPESGKAPQPIMDFLFGRAIELEITPGPKDPHAPERETREIKYTSSEISEDIVSCTNVDGSSFLSADEEEVLEAYVASMKKVWKEKDPVKRNELLAAVNAEENTKAFRTIYSRVLGEIKQVCPNLNEELGYKPWSDTVTARVQKWIDKVLAGQIPSETVAPVAEIAAAVTSESPVVTSPAEDGSDLPF